MFTVKRLHRLTDYKESSLEGPSMLTMLPPFPTKFSHLVGVNANFTGGYTVAMSVLGVLLRNTI
jgi:hypothetical protein